ncbi:hypothetical protein [Psychrobacillus sp. MER TA 171]|uniref:hypothetical protein n=1 Tax=Psychrobacillus sp. MER TA 171 TaxID=2939577 RepID=UPI00203D9F0A|nr:hypothetical protein [Psychrobacillus sp. MER TA 171]MCM3359222.1 hypothetical protein [Psychrobacillus sp. MER TA 171]
MDIVDKYEALVLKVFFESYNIPEEVSQKVSLDIKNQLYSILNIWEDIENRRAILTIGLEEATYFEPFDASVEIKAMVVVAIRNSEFENLVSTNEGAMIYGFKKSPLTDISVKELTIKSIHFFKNIDLNSLLSDLSKENNFYMNLLNEYPRTATALRHIGTWTNKGISFPKVLLENEVKSNIIDFSNMKNNILINQRENSDIQSGIDPSFSETLLNILKELSYQEFPIFHSDSFKLITRNIEKLFKIIEYILNIDGIIVTNNFFISNTYVSKRKELLKPAHNHSDHLKNLNNLEGLTKTHLKYLKLYINN